MDKTTSELVEKLVATPGETYEASNGVTLLLGSDGETVWFSKMKATFVTAGEVGAAVAEFLDK